MNGLASDVNLVVTGMTCGGCKASVERIVRKLDGAASVTVDLATGALAARTGAKPDDIIRALSAAGFPSSLAH